MQSSKWVVGKVVSARDALKIMGTFTKMLTMKKSSLQLSSSNLGREQSLTRHVCSVGLPIVE